MGVDQLLSIIIECRQFFTKIDQLQPSSQVTSLIRRIDQELEAYYLAEQQSITSSHENPHHKHHNNKPTQPLLANNQLNTSHKKPKQRIFDDSSNGSTSPNKLHLTTKPQLPPKLPSLHNLSSLPSPTKKPSQQSLSQSKKSSVSSISLGNVHLRFVHEGKEKDEFESLCDQSFTQRKQREELSQMVVNSSFDREDGSEIMQEGALKMIAQQKSQAGNNEKNHEVTTASTLSIEDFFIIDFNFETNQYQILPRKENFFDQCHVIDELLSDSQSRQQKKQTKGVSPYVGINNSSSSNSNQSQISADTLRSVFGSSVNLRSNDNVGGRYSMEAQRGYSMEVHQGDSNNSRNSSQQPGQNHPSTSHPPVSPDHLYQTRSVILHLLTHSPSFHIQQIKPTSSMTDLLKLTTNPSSKNRTLEHIVIPSFLQQRNSLQPNTRGRYTHVIKTHQGIRYGLKYYQCQRFYVIVEKEHRFTQVEEVVSLLIKKTFQLRVTKDREIDNVSFENVRKYLAQVALMPKHELCKLPLVESGGSPRRTPQGSNTHKLGTISPPSPLTQLTHYCHSSITLQFPLQLTHPKPFPLIVILLYFIIFEYKIILLTTKGYEGIMSEVVNCLVHMLGDLRYVYPVIMAVLTSHHVEFVNAPVPGVVALWGTADRCKKALGYVRRRMAEETIEFGTSSNHSQSSSSSSYSSLSPSSHPHPTNSPTTLLIDMNKHEIIDHQFTHRQMYIIESLHTYIKSHKNQNIFTTMNALFNEKLLGRESMQNPDNRKIQEGKDGWVKVLRDRLQKTQMFEEYMKFVQEGKMGKSGQNGKIEKKV